MCVCVGVGVVVCVSVFCFCECACVCVCACVSLFLSLSLCVSLYCCVSSKSVSVFLCFITSLLTSCKRSASEGFSTASLLVPYFSQVVSKEQRQARLEEIQEKSPGESTAPLGHVQGEMPAV